MLAARLSAHLSCVLPKGSDPSWPPLPAPQLDVEGAGQRAGGGRGRPRSRPWCGEGRCGRCLTCPRPAAHGTDLRSRGGAPACGGRPSAPASPGTATCRILGVLPSGLPSLPAQPPPGCGRELRPRPEGAGLAPEQVGVLPSLPRGCWERPRSLPASPFHEGSCPLQQDLSWPRPEPGWEGRRRGSAASLWRGGGPRQAGLSRQNPQAWRHRQETALTQGPACRRCRLPQHPGPPLLLPCPAAPFLPPGARCSRPGPVPGPAGVHISRDWEGGAGLRGVGLFTAHAAPPTEDPEEAGLSLRCGPGRAERAQVSVWVREGP